MTATNVRLTPQKASFFETYLLANILLGAGATILVVYVLGIKGFARIPYVNGLVYALSGAVGVVYAAANSQNLRWEKLGWPLIVWITALACSTLTGIITHNSIQYIVSWSIYCLIGMLMFCISSVDRPPHLGASCARLLDKNAFLIMAAALATLSIVLEDKLIQFPLALAIAIYTLSVRRTPTTVLLCSVILIAIHLNLSKKGLQLDVSRSGLITLALVMAMYAVYRRKFVTLGIVFASIFAMYTAAVSVDRSALHLLPRRIEEGALILRGDNMREHAATFQRFYEAKLVGEDFQGAGPMEWAFGKGLGRTIDMSGASDASVGRNALMGMRAVNNIHFLPVAVFHKFGLAGLAFLISVIAWLSGALLLDTLRGEKNKLILFCYIYIFSALGYALAASNYLIANPLWPMAVGALVSMRAIQAASRVRAHPLLNGSHSTKPSLGWKTAS